MVGPARGGIFSVMVDGNIRMGGGPYFTAAGYTDRRRDRWHPARLFDSSRPATAGLFANHRIRGRHRQNGAMAAHTTSRRRNSLAGAEKPLFICPQQRQETLPLVSRERDRRFAVPRCWSRGDSNCRSSLWFLALTKARSFSEVTALTPIRELSSERSCRQILVEKRLTSVPLPRVKRPKRTGGSNPLRSSNEALRTVRADRCFSLPPCARKNAVPTVRRAAPPTHPGASGVANRAQPFLTWVGDTDFVLGGDRSIPSPRRHSLTWAFGMTAQAVRVKEAMG